MEQILLNVKLANLTNISGIYFQNFPNWFFNIWSKIRFEITEITVFRKRFWAGLLKGTVGKGGGEIRPRRVQVLVIVEVLLQFKHVRRLDLFILYA
jgi:hypothetical protein